MRVLLKKADRLLLFNLLKRDLNCGSLYALSKEMGIPTRTLQNWIYRQDRTIPESIIPLALTEKILERKPDNWGSIKGGRATIRKIIEKYGVEEIKRRQINGGKKSNKTRRIKEKPFNLDITDDSFLELYGILLGDGWLSKLTYKGKIIWLIGISGHAKDDREFFLHCKYLINKICDRKPYQKERPKFNSIEINFGHKSFIQALNRDLGFPIGKKINLKLDDKICCLDYDKVKNVIRGIFDTDGSFYLDKTPV